MFPIRDHNPSGRTPYVTYALIALNVLFFVSYAGLADGGERVFRDWALVPATVMRGEGIVTILSSMFLHAGVMHLLGNMLFLWIFGDNMEDALGHLGFLGFYLLSGVAAVATHVAADPGSAIQVVGASGAIAGVMGGYLLLYPRAKVDILVIFIIFFRVFTIPAWILLAIWFGMQVFNGSYTSSTMGGVAYWAHAGGFIAGLVLTVPVWLAKGGTGWWRRTDMHPPHPEAKIPERISRIPVVKRRR